MVIDVPLPIRVPPHAFVNQFTIDPDPPTAVSVINGIVPEQKLLLEIVMLVGGTGAASTFTVTLVQPDPPQIFSH
jgi:hypothetical protein